MPEEGARSAPGKFSTNDQCSTCHFTAARDHRPLYTSWVTSYERPQPIRDPTQELRGLGASEDGLAPLQLAAAPAEDGVAPLPADEPTAEDGVAPLPAAGLAPLPAAEPVRAACAVRFEVVDTGVGLGDVEPVALFGERVVGPSASASALEGSGLGLYIANKIMHALGGKIALFEETRPVPDAFDSCAYTFVPVVATRALHLPVYTNVSSRVPSPAVRVAAFTAGGGESLELCAGAEGRLARPMFVPVGPWELTNLGLAARLGQPPAIELAAPCGDAGANGAVAGAVGTIPVAAEEFEAAFYLLPTTTSTRRCTVFSITLPCPSAAASPASGAAGAVTPLHLLAPARSFPAAALGASLPPVTGPSVLCVRRRAAGASASGAPAADSSAAAQDANSAAMARLRSAFRRVLVCDDDAVCRRVSSHFLQLIILPSLGIAEDGLDALRAMLVGCPPTLLAAALLPGVHDAPDDESRAWLAGRNLPTTVAAALPWPYDLILLDVQMPNKHGDGEKETRPPRSDNRDPPARALTQSPPANTEVVAQLRRLGYDGVVIAATGTSEPGATERLLRCGFDGVLKKPFSSRHISEMLRRMLGRADERRAARALQILASDGPALLSNGIVS